MKRTAIVFSALLVTGLMAGCSPSTAPSPEPSVEAGPETSTLQLGLVPVVNVAPLYLGIQQGYFEDEGLTLNPAMVQTFAANVASVLNGETQIGFGATVPLVVAMSNNVPILLVANSDVSGALPDGDNSGLFAADGSGITSIADLEGKTVAINALSNLHDTAIKSAMMKVGADPSKVNFLEVALPDMVAALQAKRVDAIAMGEPFVSAAKAAGFTLIANTYTAGFELGTPIASYFVSASWAAENPNTIKAFDAALKRSTDYAIAHPDEARAILAEYTKIPSETLSKIVLGSFDSSIDKAKLGSLIDLMVKTGTISEADKPSADAIVLNQP